MRSNKISIMDKLEIQKLRDLPIEGVAERLGLKIRQHKCLCPFHDDHHASLSFHVRRNTYRCFVCGASGGTIDLAMNLLKSSGRGSFREACRWLADENNVILTEYTSSSLNSNPSTLNSSRAVVLFNHSSSIIADRQYVKSIKKDDFFPSPAAFVYTLPNITTGEIALRNGYHGETSFYLLAERNEKLMQMVIKSTFIDHDIKSVIGGWIDCPSEDEFECEISIFCKE